MKKILKCVILMVTICLMMLAGCGITGSGEIASNQNKKNVEETVDNTQSVDGDLTQGKKKNVLEERLTVGTENYKGFQMDNVLHSDSLGEIHYHIYVPDSAVSV